MSKNNSTLPFILVALVLLGGLFLALRPDDASAPTTPPPMDKMAEIVPEATDSAEAAPQTKEPTPPRHSYDIHIEDNRLISSTKLIKVNEGDDVILHVTANQTDEFHLHGYDLLLKLSPGETATLQFTADRAGRFEFELERSHTELGAIEVYPR